MEMPSIGGSKPQLSAMDLRIPVAAVARHRSLPGEWHVVAPDLIAAEIKSFCDCHGQVGANEGECS